MSKIEWTEKTWNPLAGCDVVSPGCTNCYAMNMARRCEAMGTAKYAGTTRQVNGKTVWTGKVVFDEQALLAPLKRKRPTVYFVNSMSDLFHMNVPDWQIDMVFAVMALCEHHTFQILTKRADRMREYMTREWIDEDGWPEYREHRIHAEAASMAMVKKYPQTRDAPWPLKNVWLGVSGENQHWLMQRAPELMETPAAVRFLSYEPALGPVDLEPFVKPVSEWGNGWLNNYPLQYPKNRLDWVIAGGESGLSARPIHPDWARNVRDQCADAGVSFFFKQWGEWAPIDSWEPWDHKPQYAIRADGAKMPDEDWHDDGQRFKKIGKKAAGRLLDGSFHDAMPQKFSDGVSV